MIEHLSYSSISSYLSCGAYWKFKYVDQVKTATATALVFGSAFHATVEEQIKRNLNTLIQKGALEAVIPPEIMALNSPAEIWSEKWKAQIEKEQVDWGADTPEQLYNDGLRILAHQEIQQGILSILAGNDEQGAKIERKVELKVPGVPVPIVGYIDVITRDGVPGDLKTSAKSWSADKALDEIQPLFYLAALNQAGQTVPGWHFRHYVFVKTKTPQFQCLEHTHNPGQVMWLFKMIGNVWKGIEAGVFPENPTGWKCSPQYCEFWSICRGKYG